VCIFRGYVLMESCFKTFVIYSIQLILKLKTIKVNTCIANSLVGAIITAKSLTSSFAKFCLPSANHFSIIGIANESVFPLPYKIVLYLCFCTNKNRFCCTNHILALFCCLWNNCSLYWGRRFET
jgi:hypothetical protein